MVAKCAILSCSWRAAKEVEELCEVKCLEWRKMEGFNVCLGFPATVRNKENSFSPTSLPALITEERRVDVVTV